MAERYSNYPYRDNLTNRLFTSVGPLLQSYLENKRFDLENKRYEREKEQQYANQRKVLALQNPNLPAEDLDKYSQVDRGSFSQILQSFRDEKSKKSRGILTSALNIAQDPEVQARLQEMNPVDQGIFIQNLLEQDRAIKQEATRIRAEQRMEDKYEKREARKIEEQRLRDEGFSERQIRKYSGEVIYNKTPKGLTLPLKNLFAYRSKHALGRLSKDDIDMITDPVQKALVTGEKGKELEVMTYIQTQAAQRLGQHQNLSKMSPIEKEYRILKMAQEMAAPFAIKVDTPKKPTASDKMISFAQQKAIRKAKIKKEKELERMRWDLARLQDWG